MALSKSIEVNNSGVSATYWVVSIIQFDLIANTTWAKLTGYLSSATFSGGKTPLTDRGFTAPTPGNFSTITGSAMITAVQNYIITQPEFTGATPVA